MGAASPRDRAESARASRRRRAERSAAPGAPERGRRARRPRTPRRPGEDALLARLGARLQRLLRPPRTLRPTRAGWTFFALTFGVGFAALNTGNNLLYMVLSLLLAFLVLSGVLSEAALRGIEVRRRLPQEVFAGRPTPVRLEIRNAQRRVASFAVVVEDLLGEGPEAAHGAGRCFVLRIGPGERVIRSYALVAPRRGPLRYAGFRVSTRFPFGLFSKAMRLAAPDTLLVYPPVAPTPLRRAAARAERGHEGAGAHAGPGSEAAGLRPFVPGDPVRHVHWRSSLRRGELLVREREQEARGQAEVRLATRGVREGERFEAEVSRAASEVTAHLRAGRRVALHTDHVRFPPAAGGAQRRRLLAYLARVEPEPPAAAEAAA